MLLGHMDRIFVINQKLAVHFILFSAELHCAGSIVGYCIAALCIIASECFQTRLFDKVLQ